MSIKLTQRIKPLALRNTIINSNIQSTSRQCKKSCFFVCRIINTQKTFVKLEFIVHSSAILCAVPKRRVT
jgi:hypothetical protein